jgi:hypothetical protein
MDYLASGDGEALRVWKYKNAGSFSLLGQKV